MTAFQLVCKILQNELELLDGQVYLWNQKIMVPTDEKLYIAVGVNNIKPIGTKRVEVGDGSALRERLSGTFLASLSIDIMSKNTDARDRKEEVLLALRSTYAQSVMETYGFYIAPISTAFVNLSAIEGAAIPYRFNLSVNLQYQVTTSKRIDYYDTFLDPETLERT